MTILGAKDACEERGAVPRPPTMKAKIEVGAAAGCDYALGTLMLIKRDFVLREAGLCPLLSLTDLFCPVDAWALDQPFFLWDRDRRDESRDEAYI